MASDGSWSFQREVPHVQEYANKLKSNIERTVNITFSHFVTYMYIERNNGGTMDYVVSIDTGNGDKAYLQVQMQVPSTGEPTLTTVITKKAKTAPLQALV